MHELLGFDKLFRPVFQGWVILGDVSSHESYCQKVDSSGYIFVTDSTRGSNVKYFDIVGHRSYRFGADNVK